MIIQRSGLLALEQLIVMTLLRDYFFPPSWLVSEEF